MSQDKTTIEVSVGTWRQLNAKKNPGESFDDVITGLLAAPSQERDIDDLVAAVDALEWTTSAGTKTDTRVEAVATAAAMLEKRGMAAPIVLREEIMAQFDVGLQESSVQRLLSDLLPELEQVETRASGQIYVWDE